jgi:AcrR family transcriptional regulator
LVTAAAATAGKLGRPRQVEDDAVFAAMGNVLLRVGWARLTLILVARELSITPAALRQRFGAKHDLLVAFYAWGTARLEASLADPAAADRGGSPLEALRAMVSNSIAGLSTPQQMVNAMSAFTEVATEADLRPMAQERFALTLGGLETALDQAIARGELAGIQAATLAHQLQISLAGASLVWSITGQGALGAELLAVADLVLAPYLRGLIPPVRRLPTRSTRSV